MSKGIRSALTQVINMLEQITPKTDQYNSFVCLRHLDGISYSLESSGLSERSFDFSLRTLPEDDGLAGISLRKRVDCLIRIKYNLGISLDSTLKQVQMAEDASSVINQLLNADLYDASSTGIASIVTGQPYMDTPVQEQVQYTLLQIPFTVRFYEEMNP